MKNEKINSFGLSSLICSLCSAPFYGIFSSYTLHSSRNATPISLIIGFVISIIISYFILQFFKTNKNTNFSSKLKNIFNNFSYFLIIPTLACSLFGYILLTYRLTTFLSSQYLIETPKYILLISILLLTFYVANKGIETITRVSTISLYISIIIFLFDFFSLLPQVNFQNFLPIIDVSLNSIIISSIIFAFYFTIPIIHINIISMNQIVDKEKFNKYYYLTILIAFIMIFLSMSTTIGILGINTSNLFDYPLYTTLKRIKLFSFLDSLENISIMLWILYIINASSTMLSFVFSSLKDTFKLSIKKSKIINILILLISFAIPNFIFFNNNYNESYEYIWLPFSLLVFMFIVIIITLIKNRLTNN